MPHTFSEQVLASRGRGGYRQYRIPALAVSTAGTVLAAYDGRPNLDDLPNTIDLLLRRSHDNGATWDAQQVVRTGTGLQGFGDPSLLVDRQTGRILLFHAAGTHAGFFESADGLEPEDAIQHVDISHSDDDGASWTHRRITAQLKLPGITGIFAAAGSGIQLDAGPHAGRLLQQMVILRGGRIHAASAYSDDHGENWTLGEPSAAGANENKTVCLSDGTVLLNSRAPGHRLQARSLDGGHSYGPLLPVPTLPDPGDNGSILRLDTAGGIPPVHSGDWLLATNNRDTALRRNTVLSLSTDAGGSWGPAYTLCSGSSAYSTTALLPDGSLGVLYERQGYTELVFARLPAEALEPAELLAAVRGHRDDDGGEFTMVLRSITPAPPAQWTAVGESLVLGSGQGRGAAAPEWDVHTWKEIGQGYGDRPQVLGTREAQDLNHGPAAPGLGAGDLLAFTGRFRNTEATTVVAVLAGGHRNAAGFPPREVPAGAELLFFTPVYTVTADDVASGAAVVRFTLDAGSRSWECVFRADAATGEVRVLPRP